MALIIPSPPGFASGFDDSPPPRFQPPNPGNFFVLSTFERGSAGQITGPSEVTPQVGGRANNSAALDAIYTLLAEGGSQGPGTITYSRVTGPDAVVATKTIGTSLKFTADSPGAWANDLTIEVEAAGVGGTSRRIVIREDSVTVATSAASATNAGLAGTFPGITPASYVAAAGKLDRRYGPGTLIVPGVTSLDVHTALLDHLLTANRRAAFELDVDVTESDAIEHSLSLEADNPQAAERWDLFASTAATLPIAGQPERPVSWATVQTGIASRVFRDLGVGPAPFGPNRGRGQTVQRLVREFSTLQYPGGEVQRLYAGHVNAAVDRGQTICLEGYRSGSRDELLQDSHACFVRMVLAWRGEMLAYNRLGDPVDNDTIADYGGDLIALCKEFVRARAINDDDDPGYRVDVASVNTKPTKGRRELHGLIRYRPTGSVDWADILVGAVRPLETI